ncbi:hypothetical protein C8F01DRAFT_1312098 [Mycena amicta]|nr:hypothetical protein C8F01DRAFT_1312098 [Mycena amicta]
MHYIRALDFSPDIKIVRKFHNHRAKLAKKAPGESSDGAIQSAQSHPLLAFAAPVSARKIFEDEQKDAIMAEVDSRLASEPHSNKVAMYQSVLKERWNELDVREIHTRKWRKRAERRDWNQTEFIGSTTLALRKLCSSKTLGGAEMVLLYAVREPKNGDLIAGSIHAHAPQNRIKLQFGGNSREEQCAVYGDAWAAFADSALPRPFNPKANTGIPRNASGQPIFPLVNLDDLSAADMRAVLTEYLNECWAHQRSSPEAPSIPWGALGENPETYFDTARFKFSAALGEPRHLTSVAALLLAQELAWYSANDSPFCFYNVLQSGADHNDQSPPSGTPSPVVSSPDNNGEPPDAESSAAQDISPPPPPPVVEEPKQIGGKALKRKAKAGVGDHHKEPAGKRKQVIEQVAGYRQWRTPTSLDVPVAPRINPRSSPSPRREKQSRAKKSAAGFTWMKMATKLNRINLAVGINPVQPRLNDIQQLWHSTARLHGLNGVRLILVYGSYKPGNQSTLARLDGQGLSEAGRVAALIQTLLERTVLRWIRKGCRYRTRTEVSPPLIQSVGVIATHRPRTRTIRRQLGGLPIYSESSNLDDESKGASEYLNTMPKRRKLLKPATEIIQYYIPTGTAREGCGKRKDNVQLERLSRELSLTQNGGRVGTRHPLSMGIQHGGGSQRIIDADDYDVELVPSVSTPIMTILHDSECDGFSRATVHSNVGKFMCDPPVLDHNPRAITPSFWPQLPPKRIESTPMDSLTPIRTSQPHPTSQSRRGRRLRWRRQTPKPVATPHGTQQRSGVLRCRLSPLMPSRPPPFASCTRRIRSKSSQTDLRLDAGLNPARFLPFVRKMRWLLYKVSAVRFANQPTVAWFAFANNVWRSFGSCFAFGEPTHEPSHKAGRVAPVQAHLFLTPPHATHSSRKLNEDSVSTSPQEISKHNRRGFGRGLTVATQLYQGKNLAHLAVVLILVEANFNARPRLDFEGDSIPFNCYCTLHPLKRLGAIRFGAWAAASL